MNELIFIINESPEGGFEAKALDHPIFTEADTVEQLKSMIKDAVKCHFNPGDIPMKANSTSQFRDILPSELAL